MNHFQDKFYHAVKSELEGSLCEFKVFAYSMEEGKEFDVQYSRDEHQVVLLKIMTQGIDLKHVHEFQKTLQKAEEKMGRHLGSVHVGTGRVGNRVGALALEAHHMSASFVAVEVLDGAHHRMTEALLDLGKKMLKEIVKDRNITTATVKICHQSGVVEEFPFKTQ